MFSVHKLSSIVNKFAPNSFKIPIYLLFWHCAIKSIILKKLILILFLITLSCKSSGQINTVESETILEKVTNPEQEPTIELNVGPNIKVADVVLNDFKKFEVWVTTRTMDTIGDCRLEKVHRIKGLDTLPHFFIKFKTIPVVYKMKMKNDDLVFAGVDR